MHRLLKLFGPLLFPFLLSWLPVAGLLISARQRGAFEHERLSESWKERAQFLTDEIRGGATYEDQMHRMGGDLRRHFSRITDPEFRLTGNHLIRAIRRYFPASHLPRDCAIFGFSLPPGPSTRRLEVLRSEGLTMASGRAIANMLKNCMDTARLGSDERRKLTKQLQGLFGDSQDFDAFADTLRGGPFPARFLGKTCLIHWDILDTRESTIGAFLLVIPLAVRERSRPLAAILHDKRVRSPGIHPFLVPFPGEEKEYPLIKPPVLPASRALLRRFATAISWNRDQRNRAYPFGHCVATEDGFFLQRHLLKADIPYEAWMVGPIPEGTSRHARAGILTVSIFLLGFWLPVFLRVWIDRQPPPLTMRIWMMVFFLFMAVASGASLYVMATHYIETVSTRRMDDLKNDLKSDLRRFDEGFNLVLGNHSRHFDMLFRNREQMNRMINGSLIQQNAQKNFWAKIMRELDPPIHLLEVLVYPLNPPGEYLGFWVEEHLKLYTEVRVGVFGQLLDGALAQFHGTEEQVKALRKGRTSLMGGPAEILDGALDPAAYRSFLSLRRQSALISREHNRAITYYDFFANHGKIIGMVVMVAKADDAFSSFLQETLARENAAATDRSFAFGRRELNNFSVLAPRDSKYWNSRDGRNMQRLLLSANDSSTERFLVTSNGIFNAVPSEKVKGFVLAGFRSFTDIVAWKSRAEMLLFVILSLFIAFTFVLGFITADHLLIPLADVEQGLLAVSRGDLSRRLRRQRNDELGDLCHAFDAMIDGIQERRALGSFVSGQLDALVSKTGPEDTLTPERRHAVILVSDLRGFTTLTERYPATEIVSMLNQHHRAMSEEIKSNSGFVELFIGDAVVAFFPDLPIGSAGKTALQAARGMMSRHRLLQRERLARGTFSYDIGIGLDFGEVMAGTLGTSDRREYVVIGPARERAEVLEGLSKQGKHSKIILSPAMAGQCPEASLEQLENQDAFELRENAQPC
jgi:class 3 adenylate cyclase